MPDRNEPPLIIPKDLLNVPVSFGDSLTNVKHHLQQQSTTADFRLDGFGGKLGLHHQAGSFAELNMRVLATDYSQMLRRVFKELRLHDGPYAPRVIFDPQQLPDKVQGVTVSFREPIGNNYHSAEVIITMRDTSGKPTKVQFSISKTY